MKFKYLGIIALGSSLLLAGCGGTDSTTPANNPDPGAGNNNPTVTGVVASTADEINTTNTLTVGSGTGAIVYDTSTATFINEGVTADSSMLTPGMVVTVKGVHANGKGVADMVSYDSEVEGFVVSSDITGITPASPNDPMTYTGTMNVMGQSIIIDEMTKFSGFDHQDGVVDPTMIVTYNVVEVSGIFQDDGTVMAKHVEYKALSLKDGDEIEIKGYVTAYDATGGIDGIGSFMLGSCTINVTNDTKNEIAVLEDGMKVEVESIFDKNVSTDPCEINAKEIEDKDRSGFMKMDYAEGMVVADLANDMFEIQKGNKAPVQVMVDADTKYMNGTIDSIVAGAKLKAVGMINADMILVAKMVKFEDMGMKPDMVKGVVATDLLDGMFTLTDAATGIDVIVEITAKTLYPMGGSAADIAIDVALKAVGKYDATSGNLVAHGIMFDNIDMPMDMVMGKVGADPVAGVFEVTDMDGKVVTVIVNADTQYLPMGKTEADIMAGVMLGAAGKLITNTDNTQELTAMIITIPDMGGVKPPMPGVPVASYKGMVEEVVVDAADPALGSITVLGNMIMVTADTKIMGDFPVVLPTPGGGGVPMPTLADIAVGDYVKVMSSEDGTGALVAISIKLLPAPSVPVNSVVMGAITAADVAAGTLTVGGVDITIDVSIEITPTGTTVESIAAALQAGDMLGAEVEGTYDAATMVFTADLVKTMTKNIL